MSKEGKTGVTTTTPKNILFGAGTIHKNLKFTAGTGGTGGTWNFTESIMGATNGGSSIEITPEIYDVPLDGKLVKAKETNVKTGETATMTINFAEVTKDILKAAVIGTNGTSADSAYDLIESKPKIETGDYLDNIAFVGKTLDGRNVIVIMDNALCTSGFKSEGKNKEATTSAYTFECNADLTGDLDKLPYHIYFPKATA